MRQAEVLARTQETRESGTFRSFVELPLQRGESPLFALSWSLFHVIGDASPLSGQTRADLEAVEAAFAGGRPAIITEPSKLRVNHGDRTITEVLVFVR